MRHLILTATVASAVLVAFTGCDERTNMRVAPNRDGHAYYDPAHKPQLGVGPVAAEGEVWYTVTPKDTLYTIAKTHDMTVEELIKRNEIKPDHKLHPGDQIIVKKK